MDFKKRILVNITELLFYYYYTNTVYTVNRQNSQLGTTIYGFHLDTLEVISYYS